MESPQMKSANLATVLSWLGFGIATGLFIFIWIINTIALKDSFNSHNSLHILFALVFMIGGILCILAIIFSIIGLIMAIKNNAPKWMGICGIILCALSMLSVFVPIICNILAQPKTAKIITPSSTATINHNVVSPDITIQIYANGHIRCINNTTKDNNIIGNISTYSRDLNQQLTSWLKLNKIKPTTTIEVKVSRNADYADIAKVIDVLNKNKCTNFSLKNDPQK